MPSAEPDGRLAATLRLVTETITTSLGFEVAVANLVDGERAVVAAVSGPDEVRRALLGHSRPLADWDRLLAASTRLGALHFLDHRNVSPDEIGEILAWRPDLPVRDDPDAWHPDDALFAVLSSSDGDTLGMLSVDVPCDGRRPGVEARQALEAFAITASLAIEHASLAAQARQGRHRFQAVFESSPIPIGLLGADRRWLRVNGAFARFLGRPVEELVGMDPKLLTHPDDIVASDELAIAVRRREPGAELRSIEKRYLLPDGTEVWGRLHLARLSDDEPDLLVAQVEDITDRRHAESLLRRQAHEDPLTGLANRAETVAAVSRGLDADARRNGLTALLFCDADRLKWLNDSQGHAVGDRYLQEVGTRLATTVRSGDTVGRIGGDEFVVVAPGLRRPEEAEALAERLIAAVRRPWRYRHHLFQPSISVGIAWAKGGDLSADELLSRADLAMYRAKAEDRGSWRVWDEAEWAGVPDISLRSALPRALARSELVLHYQPIIRLADQAVVGHEALLRWQHPRLGLLGPERFLDVVLNSEYESPVTDWVLREACAQAADHDGIVTVNVSSVQVTRRDLPAVVEDALARAGLSPTRLVLELTEDRLLSRPDGAAHLADLRDLGVGIALDDFGTGYAGLEYLLRFDALTAVKLDRSFVVGLGRNPASERITRAVVGLAEDCGLDLVVEGVEDQAQATAVRELGVPYAQGWFYGVPVPWSDVRPAQAVS
jgi:diguanylate cyclase (GGDEF)-like protein/PAS domain S-box-containing protein